MFVMLWCQKNITISCSIGNTIRNSQHACVLHRLRLLKWIHFELTQWCLQHFRVVTVTLRGTTVRYISGSELALILVETSSRQLVPLSPCIGVTETINQEILTMHPMSRAISNPHQLFHGWILRLNNLDFSRQWHNLIPGVVRGGKHFVSSIYNMIGVFLPSIWGCWFAMNQTVL